MRGTALRRGGWCCVWAFGTIGRTRRSDPSSVFIALVIPPSPWKRRGGVGNLPADRSRGRRAVEACLVELRTAGPGGTRRAWRGRRGLQRAAECVAGYRRARARAAKTKFIKSNLVLLWCVARARETFAIAAWHLRETFNDAGGGPGLV